MSTIRIIYYAVVLLSLGHAGGLQAANDMIGPEGSMAPELSAGANGNLYFSWIEAHGNGHALRFAVFEDEGWSETHTVAVGDDWSVNWADWPSVTALGNGVLVANWRRRTGASSLAYEIKMAMSQDGGKSWKAPITLNDDGTATQHGFVSIVPGHSRLDIIWLDGRRTTKASGEAEAMTLRHAVVNADGSIEASTELDARTCDCCPTSLIEVPGGLLTAYRDRTQEDIRDIVVRDNVGGRWSVERPVHEDNWEFAGCPINGPALDAQGSMVAAAWFTAPSKKPQVLVALSRDGGISFGTPIRASDKRTLGRTDLVILDDSETIVSWVERRTFSSRLILRRIRADGTVEQPRVLGDVEVLTNGFPRMVRHGKNLVFAWTEKAGRSGRVHAVVIAVEEL